jgi:hypothetical protein
MTRRLLVGTVLVAVSNCELGEINIPPTEPLVVVQAVMRPDRVFQWILVEQTLTGRTAGQASVDLVPSNRELQAPVLDARVFVTNVSYPSDPCGAAVEFRQTPPPPNETEQSGVYWSPQGCPTMRAGDTLELRVEALDSTVTGRTEVPGFTLAVLQAGGASVTSPLTQLEFNRDTDTLDASVEATHGRAIHVELHRTLPDGVDSVRAIQEGSAWFWVDSTGMTLPGNLINLFEGEFEASGGNAPDLFVAGFEYVVTTAYMDQNLFDAFRSANFPLSGRGYISSVSGGYGLFGSLVAQPNTLRVIGDVDDPREGTFDLTGIVEGVAVNLELELYVGRQWISGESSSPFGAFANGNWVNGPLARSISGRFSHGGFVQLPLERDAAAGTGPGGIGWMITGAWPQNGPSELSVFHADGGPDTLRAVKR